MIPERYETPITQIRETPITQIRFAADPGRAIGLDRAWARGFAFDGKMKARLAARERMVSQSAKCGGCSLLTRGKRTYGWASAYDLC